MLQKLTVRNYALIRELDLSFDNGLTIITGETGAGKSILLGALSLILGSRADSALLLDREEKCIVEGYFKIDEYDLKDLFSENDLDYESPAIFRREITPGGKSRAFINDTPVTVSVMKDLGEKLIDIHSQHQSLMLNSSIFQLNIIDSFAGTGTFRAAYTEAYYEYRKLRKEYDLLKEKADRSKADMEYNQFLYNQLSEANLRAGEQDELERELEILEHVEEVKQALINISSLLSGDTVSVLSMIHEVKATAGRISNFLPAQLNLTDRLASTLIELDDLSSEIEKLSRNTEADPGRMTEIETRLDLIYTLIRKHRVKDINDLINRKEELSGLLQSIASGDERLEELEKLLETAGHTLSRLSDELSTKRLTAIPDIEGKITDLLKQLGMPNARFRINLTRARDYTPYGIDEADFLFSANRQTEPENIARVASGGELSRVMLSLKSLLTRSRNLPTIIFDEIDSGVSGEVADKVGRILEGMGRYMQVINITHLPQVAARGRRHFHVYKEDSGDSTITRIRLLSSSERVLEVARLLSGSEVTETSIKNARELIKAGSQIE